MIDRSSVENVPDPWWKIGLICVGIFAFSLVMYRMQETRWPMGSVVMVICAVPTYLFMRRYIDRSFTKWMVLWIVAAVVTAALESVWGGPYP